MKKISTSCKFSTYPLDKILSRLKGSTFSLFSCVLLLGATNTGAQNKTNPVITWPVPQPIIYGTTLSNIQLNATANVAGNYFYEPDAGAKLNAGTQMLSTTFTPIDSANYSSVTTTVSISVGKVSLLVKANDKTKNYNEENPTLTASYIRQLKIVVLGSSTAQGNGATPSSNSWINLLVSRLNSEYPDMVSFTNLANGALSTYSILPTGTDNGNRQAVDPARNITAALALNPRLIIINLPSNDVASGYTTTNTLNNFTTIINTANAAGVKVILTGTQPRNDLSLASRQLLFQQNIDMLGRFGDDCLNIYDELTNITDYTIKAEYMNDQVHVNNDGHAFIYSQILPSVRNWIETFGNGFVNGDNESDLSGSANLSSAATVSSPIGKYPIIASGDLSSPNYSITYANGELTVNKNTAIINLGNLSQYNDGSPKQVTVTTDPANLPVVITYDGSPVVPSSIGSYMVVATVSDPNYLGTASGTLIINSSATISLTELSQTYDGGLKSATVTTNPAGLSYSLTYNGSTEVPTNAGIYEVIATITDPNYTGSASGTLVIDKATPAINWLAPSTVTYGTALSATQLNASAYVQGNFSYTPEAGTVLNAGSHTLSSIFTPADAANYESITTIVSFTIDKSTILVKANDKTRKYAAANPDFTASYLGKIKVVVIGSSTAAGNGASTTSKSWVNLLTSRLNKDYPGIISVTNLGIGGLTTYGALPTGTNNGFRQPVNPDRNITAALALNPQVIIINLPNNDVVSGYTAVNTLNNFATIINLSKAAGAKVLLTGTQPRNDINLSGRQLLEYENQEMLVRFPNDCINIYNELTDLANWNIAAQYSHGDGIHLNDAGHFYIYSQFVPQFKNWIESYNNGFVNGESQAVLNGYLDLNCAADGSSPIGLYNINATGDLSSPNYTISYAGGTLTVENRNIIGDRNIQFPSLTPVFQVQNNGGILSIWPNPFTNVATIYYRSFMDSRVTIELLNILGARVRQIYTGRIVNGSHLKVDLSNYRLAKGMYIIRLTTDTHVINKKVEYIQ